MAADLKDVFEHLPTAPNLNGQITILSYRPIYSGTNSCIYRGEIQRENKKVTVVLKVPNHTKGTTHKTMLRRMNRERRTWGALKHPNIVPLLGFVDDDDIFQPYGALVSPWYRRGDAVDFIKEHGHLMTIKLRADLWTGVVAGVDYLHSHEPPLIHGDLKSRNILIDEVGNPQITDLGLVRICLQEGTCGMTTTTEYTGTTCYLAYELVTVAKSLPTTASDVYAIGCIGLEFIFSQIPHATRIGGFRHTEYAIYAAIKEGIPPAECPPNLSPFLSLVWMHLVQCWDLLPLMRPQASSLLARLNSQEFKDKLVEEIHRRSAEQEAKCRVEAHSRAEREAEEAKRKVYQVAHNASDVQRSISLEQHPSSIFHHYYADSEELQAREPGYFGEFPPIPIDPPPVQHSPSNEQEINSLETYLQNIIRYSSESEIFQTLALDSILYHRRQNPPAQICRIDRRNGLPIGVVVSVTCLLCLSPDNSAFNGRNSLRVFSEHFMRKHLLIEKPFACFSCGRSFPFSQDRDRHEKVIHRMYRPKAYAAWCRRSKADPLGVPLHTSNKPRLSPYPSI